MLHTFTDFYRWIKNMNRELFISLPLYFLLYANFIVSFSAKFGICFTNLNIFRRFLLYIIHCFDRYVQSYFDRA